MSKFAIYLALLPFVLLVLIVGLVFKFIPFVLLSMIFLFLTMKGMVSGYTEMKKNMKNEIKDDFLREKVKNLI